MPDYATYDPGTGARSTSWPTPGAPMTAFNPATGEWAPNSAPSDSHDEPFDTGDGSPGTGPIPPNIVGGESERCLDCVDGEADDPHDGNVDDGDDTDDGDDDEGPVADNIVLRGGQRYIPGPMSRSRMGI